MLRTGRAGRTGQTDVRTDSGDYMPPTPIENGVCVGGGGGIKTGNVFCLLQGMLQS